MNDGGPAFQQGTVYVAGNQQQINTGPQGGMTLRDYFAAKVIVPFIAAIEAQVLRPDPVPDNFSMEARNAYAIADAMLKAREQ